MTSMGNNKGAPLRPNQIRMHTNAKGISNYYITYQHGTTTNEASIGIIWFRKNVEEPMFAVSGVTHLAWDLREDPVIVDNVNLMKDALDRSILVEKAKEEVIKIYKSGEANTRKIASIKKWIEITGDGLKEAKLEVEQLELQYGFVS